MSEYPHASPLLDGFSLGKPDAGHDGVTCFPAIRKDSEKRFVLKQIDLPATQAQSRALLLSGAYAGPDAVAGYYQELAREVCKEVELLEQLAARRGFLAFHGHQMMPMDDGIGWRVCLLAPRRRSLPRFLKREPMTYRGAVELGIDICAALALCRDTGWLYANLKPENIFRMADGEWRIGDLGFVSLDSLEKAALPDRCRSAYTAPEVADASSHLNATMDIYALGMLLYELFNGGRLPFCDEESRASFLESQKAGRAMDAPRYADPDLAAILLKACAFDPKDRYPSPDALGHALVQYHQSHAPQDAPLVWEEPQKTEAPAPPPPPPPEPPAPKAVPPVKPRRRFRFPWRAFGLLVLLGTLITLGLGYRHHFVHTVDSLVCQGKGTTLTVTLATDLEPELLTVLCKNTYGNALRAKPENGAVTFQDLLPGTQYLITLEVEVPHRLRGQTSATYSTPSETNITHMTAVTGQEPGSAIVSFGVEGIDSESWTLTCAAEGQEEKSVTFEDHTVVIKGLHIGAEYTFRLTAPVDIRLAGQTTLTHTASDLVYPRNLQVADYSNGILTVTWDAPRGIAVERWLAHCFDDAGTDQLQECTGTTAIFDNVTPGSIYTIEITASTMTLGKRIQFEVGPEA